jgi:hypothetical protein
LKVRNSLLALVNSQSRRRTLHRELRESMQRRWEPYRFALLVATLGTPFWKYDDVLGPPPLKIRRGLHVRYRSFTVTARFGDVTVAFS